MVRMIATSGPQPDVLYVVHRFPYPPDKGDRIRAFHLLRWLSHRARVHLACLADEAGRAEGRRLRRLELGLSGWARAVTLVSEAEAELYRRVGGHAAVAITNGVDLDAFRPTPAAGGSSCVFVGALDYPPNVDAAVWFCR